MRSIIKKIPKIQLLSLALAVLTLSLSACTIQRAELGSAKNPIKFFFTPSVDAAMIMGKAKSLKTYLEANTPYVYEVLVPQSYVAVVEAFGSDRADVAVLNTFGYIMANEKFGAEARITSIRFGLDSYKGQIVAKSNGPIKKIEDIDGKKFAYVDPTSTSGYLMPADLFMKKGIKPSDTVFAKKHDNVILMIYQGQVDAGATFYTPTEEGKIQDARRLLLTSYPEVEKEISIIELTESIPNDPIVFRKNMPEEIKEKITESLLAFVNTPGGRETLKDLYGITGLVRGDDSRYNAVREMLKALGKKPEDLVKK